VLSSRLYGPSRLRTQSATDPVGYGPGRLPIPRSDGRLRIPSEFRLIGFRTRSSNRVREKAERRRSGRNWTVLPLRHRVAANDRVRLRGPSDSSPGWRSTSNSIRRRSCSASVSTDIREPGRRRDGSRATSIPPGANWANSTTPPSGEHGRARVRIPRLRLDLSRRGGRRAAPRTRRGSPRDDARGRSADGYEPRRSSPRDAQDCRRRLEHVGLSALVADRHRRRDRNERRHGRDRGHAT